MSFFKILLIILISAPVIALALYFYFQMYDFIRKKNMKEKALIKGEAELRPAAVKRSKEKREIEKSEKPDKKREKDSRETARKNTKGKSAKDRKIEDKRNKNKRKR